MDPAALILLPGHGSQTVLPYTALKVFTGHIERSKAYRKWWSFREAAIDRASFCREEGERFAARVLEVALEAMMAR